MSRELIAQLMRTPTVEIANVSTGNVETLSSGRYVRIMELTSVARRNRLSRDGKALPDGSYPIERVGDLKRAVEAYAGAATDKARIRKHIKKRAADMDRYDALPPAWSADAVVAAAAPRVTDSSAMIAVYPPPEVAQALAGGQEGDLPPEEMHVTLAYLADLAEEDIEQVKRAVQMVTSQSPSLTARVGGILTFLPKEPGGDAPHCYNIDALGLASLRTSLVKTLADAGVQLPTDHDFTPHMTIRYGGEVPSPDEPLSDEASADWPITHVYLVRGDDKILEAPLLTEQAITAGSQAPLGRSPKTNWVEKAGGLPGYVREVARGIAKSGHSLDRAIPIAIGVIRNWATGKGDVSASTRVKATAAIAQWEAMKKRAAASSSDTVELSYFEQRTLQEMGDTDMAVEYNESLIHFWDEANGIVYRVIADNSVEQIPVGDASGAWTSSDISADEVVDFVAVDDEETFNTILAADDEPELGEDTTETVTAAGEPEPTIELGDESKADDRGRQFVIPVVIPENVWSGDRRRFSMNSLEFKDLPMPLFWQRESDDGHKGSVTVGRIDSIERLEGGGLGNARGTFDTHEDAVEAQRQVAEKFLTGVSGDVDKFKHELSQNDDGDESIEISSARLVGATLVGKPAFQEASISIVSEDGEEAVIVASAGPLFPSRSWFAEPQMNSPQMLTVEDDGRVHGLIAEWGTSHTGRPELRAPKSLSGYRYFNRRPVRTKEGDDVRCGQLTLTGGHAALSMSADAVTRHYDDTRSAVADVVVGENEFGIWAAGAMRSDITPEQIRAFRASEPSGDWRMRDGNLELLACCMVNTPGFPVMPRALVASGDEVYALVAAGAPHHVRKTSLADQVREFGVRLEQLAGRIDARDREELRERARAALRVDQSS